MPPLTNPHDLNPPDYAAVRYAARREALMHDFGISEAQAIVHLTNIWQEQNTFDCQDWDDQAAAQAILERQQEEQRQAEADEIRKRQEDERDQAKQDERKKNRKKFLPYADVPMSAVPPVIPSPLALRKLRKGEFCELYFFTNKGLEDAQATAYSADDDALAITQDDHGLHSFIPLAAAKAKQSVISDKDLSWQQIDEATHRMIQAMRECEWEEPRVQSHVDFWIALGTHSWRHHHDERRRRALIHYQAVARKRWHDCLGTPNSFNLKYIQQTTLDDIRTEIVDASSNAAATSAKEASTSLSHLAASPLPFLFPPSSPLLPFFFRAPTPNNNLPTYMLHAPNIRRATTPIPFSCHYASQCPATDEQANERLAAFIASMHPSHATSALFTSHQRVPSGTKRPAPSSPTGDNAHKRTRSFRNPPNPVFTTNTEPLPPCAVCLSIELHSVPVAECDKEKTWDNKHEAFAKRRNRQLLVKATDQRICTKWQRKDGCAQKRCFAHLCSGCGSSTHGAISCPRAQKRTTSDPI